MKIIYIFYDNPSLINHAVRLFPYLPFFFGNIKSILLKIE